MCNLRALEARLDRAWPQITGLPVTSQVQLPKLEHVTLSLDSVGSNPAPLSDCLTSTGWFKRRPLIPTPPHPTPYFLLHTGLGLVFVSHWQWPPSSQAYPVFTLLLTLP